MIAFKFRGSDQIPFALDIILNNRLYCADWQLMDDPMEGSFTYSHSPDNQDEYNDKAYEILDEKKRRRVCSLSLTCDVRLLWAHYASGFSGLAIVLEVPDDSSNVKVVEYISSIAHVPMASYRGSPDVVDEILSTKHEEWSYEREVRILQEDVWFRLNKPIRRVICGYRMNHAMYQALEIVCKERNIPISRMYIDAQGIDILGVRSPASQFARAYKKLKQS